MRLLLLLCLFGSILSAQTIDTEKSRFMGSPNGRTGSYAPFRVVVEGLGGTDSIILRSVSGGVVLEKQVAVAGVETAEVVIPVLVADDAVVSVSSGPGDALVDEYRPKLPLRRIEPDYARPYVAVFSTDPLYARGVLPSAPNSAICDYFELSEFFGDWRLLDAYDVVVIFNPSDLRLPPGSQRAIAEFCSLGGACLIVGSFRLGEKAVDLPPPAEPTIINFRAVQAQRFGYGPGAIYRFGAEDLRRSRSAQLVLVDAMLDHTWYGADRAPAGKLESRLAPQRTPTPTPLPPDDASPTPFFWALGGGLLLLCGLVPIVAGRISKRTWPAQILLLVGCSGIGALALIQTRPLATVEASALVRLGEGGAASARMFVIAEEGWHDAIKVKLDDASDRSLPRRMPSEPGWRAWVIDTPLVGVTKSEVESVEMAFGMVGDVSFRDFGAQARRGETEFSTSEAFLVEWWLEANAYRGRRAALDPMEWPTGLPRYEDARFVTRGAIGVTSRREGG